ncbi:hypothetical protein SAMN02910353_00307 [Ruminococcus sp. YRD2003]|uniref:hypothetical protein n=1 Tax=Ruminococcus sp. YRD2003 TaxID=1452313 RepID=UPI0008B5E3EB|nr:hypothetical protein SAMN02910353_00307 [Ruminococcus flavefaciens]
MKNITKRIIALFAVVCVAASSFAGCGDKESSSKSASSEEAVVQMPLEIGSAKDGNAIGTAPAELTTSAPAATTTAAAEDTTEIEDVTDADGQPVTTVAVVTDASGAAVTDAAGSTVTEVVKVTTVVNKPAATAEAPTTAAVKYESKQDGRYAMWLDISKDENFFFEGDFLHIVFKVKEGIPDGDYKVRISPDLSDVAGTAVYPSKVIDGTVRVNKGNIDAIDVSGESGMVFYGSNVACKQGDTIDCYINIKNNTGLVAFVIWFYFDSNALEFVSAEASGEYKKIARDTEVGAGGKSAAAAE